MILLDWFTIAAIAIGSFGLGMAVAAKLLGEK